MVTRPAVPASTVTVPLIPERHCAWPLASIVATVAMLPLHMPLAVPIHHVGLLTPMAENGTIPPGKFCASALAGLTATGMF